MNIHQYAAEQAGASRDVVVVIDVLRAFTTAAFAFAAGARRIILVAEVDEAFALRDRLGGGLLMGEVGGIPIDGFDLGNSPAALEDAGADNPVRGRDLIFRTSSGTRAALAAREARVLLLASFVCAAATAEAIRGARPESVGLVSSGRKNGSGGDDDGICADYLQAVLSGTAPEYGDYHARLMASQGAARFKRGNESFPYRDLELAGSLDRFDFAMRAAVEDDLLIVRPEPSRAA